MSPEVVEAFKAPELQIKSAKAPESKQRAQKRISFETWFTRTLSCSPKLRIRHKESLRLWMQKRGCGDSEEAATYDKSYTAY